MDKLIKDIVVIIALVFTGAIVGCLFFNNNHNQNNDNEFKHTIDSLNYENECLKDLEAKIDTIYIKRIDTIRMMSKPQIITKFKEIVKEVKGDTIVIGTENAREIMIELEQGRECCKLKEIKQRRIELLNTKDSVQLVKIKHLEYDLNKLHKKIKRQRIIYTAAGIVLVIVLI